jgi:hypothetical protein
MSAEVQESHNDHHNLTKVDSAVDDTTPASPSDVKPKHRRSSSIVEGVFSIYDLGKVHHFHPSSPFDDVQEQHNI